MLRGLPVVTSDLGAFAEVIGQTGFTFRAGDAVALVAELVRILDDPSLAIRMGRSARQRAIEFCDFRRMLEAHARVYEDLRSP